MPKLETIARAAAAAILFSVFALLAMLCGLLAFGALGMNAGPLAIPMILAAVLMLMMGTMFAVDTARGY